MQFVLTVWRRVLTAAQTAHLHVTAFPAAVDLLRVSEVLAQQAGQPPSCSLIGMGVLLSGICMLEACRQPVGHLGKLLHCRCPPTSHEVAAPKGGCVFVQLRLWEARNPLVLCSRAV